MDGAVDDLNNSGKLETERHISQDITYMCSRKMETKERNVQSKHRLTNGDTKCRDTIGGNWGSEKDEVRGWH